MAAAQRTKDVLGQIGVQASPVEMAEFLTLRERVKEAGATLLEAVEYFMRHGAVVTEPKRVPELVEDFLWDKEEAQRSARTMQTLRSYLRMFARAFPLTNAHEVTAAQIDGWLRGRGWSKATQNIALGHLRGFFRWAMSGGRKYVSKDPTLEVVARPDDVPEEIGVLTVPQCRLLLAAALKDRRWLGYVALGLYCGLRREELVRLEWTEVHLEEKQVVVLGKNAKTRARRVVDLDEAAVAWIRAGYGEEKPSGRVVGDIKRWAAWRKKAGVGVWPKNALRHTFASMHYAMHQDEAKLQVLMGHESKEVLHTNYRALVRRAAAVEFWGLRPPVPGIDYGELTKQDQV